MNRRRRLIAAIAAAVTLTAATSAQEAPITSVPPDPSLPAFQGHAFKADPLPPGKVTVPPQNPHMAANPGSNVHNDTWMTDAYQIPGPLGRSLEATSEGGSSAICVSLAFDSHGRI